MKRGWRLWIGLGRYGERWGWGKRAKSRYCHYEPVGSAQNSELRRSRGRLSERAVIPRLALSRARSRQEIKLEMNDGADADLEIVLRIGIQHGVDVVTFTAERNARP